jgi:hypothetical protein
MSRIQMALAWAFAAALVLTNSACEHKACDEALKICRADFGNERKATRPQVTNMDGLKTALTHLQAKVPWPTEGPADPLTTRSSKVDKDGVGKAAKRQAGVEQAAGSHRT